MTSLILIVLSQALAQDPDASNITTPLSALLQDLSEGAEEGTGEDAALPAYVYTTESVTLIRWLGDETTTVTLDAGRQIEVVLEDDGGEMVRVRSGTDFGWLSRDKITAEAPEQP